jgi:hypothetical protein
MTLHSKRQLSNLCLVNRYASMPEQVKRPNPWRKKKMMMMMIKYVN